MKTDHGNIITLLKADMKNIWRDDYLAYILLMPVALALLLRWGLGPALGVLESGFRVSWISSKQTISICAILLMLPLVSGMMAGFLWLEQRDSGIFSVLMITPLSLRQYVIYSLCMPIAFAFVGTFTAFFISEPSFLPVSQYLLLALSSVPIAPLSALFMLCFAENKVQGFAMMKGSIALWAAPIASFYIDGKWNYFLGIIPLYWPCRLYQAFSASSDYMHFLLAGVLYSVLIIFVLLRRLEKTW